MEKQTYDSMKWLADSMIDNFPGCILRISYAGTRMDLEYVSDGIERVTGYTREEYEEGFRKSAAAHLETAGEIWGKEFLEEALHTGNGLRREFEFIGKNGESRWVEVRSSLVKHTEEKTEKKV